MSHPYVRYHLAYHILLLLRTYTRYCHKYVEKTATIPKHVLDWADLTLLLSPR